MKSSGLHHKSLLKLTLMESVMKESQRLEPATLSALFHLLHHVGCGQDRYSGQSQLGHGGVVARPLSILINDEHPELIQPLREEVVSVFESSGLHHKSLLKLTLMDVVKTDTAVSLSWAMVAS
jgi:hypothetical protein